jgi:hypothetical protein
MQILKHVLIASAGDLGMSQGNGEKREAHLAAGAASEDGVFLLQGEMPGRVTPTNDVKRCHAIPR